MFCNNCGNKLNDGDKFCMTCGQMVQVGSSVQYASDDGQVYCVFCGYPIAEGEEECSNCGCPTEVTNYVKTGEHHREKPKVTLHIWSIICSLFISVVAGAVLAIIATVQAIKSGNKTLMRWSVATIIVCVIACVINIIVMPIIYNFIMAILGELII